MNIIAADRLREACAARTHAERVVTNARQVQDERRRRAEIAEAEKLAAGVDDVVRLDAAHREATAIADAATRRLGEAQRAFLAADDEVKAAQDAARQAAYAVVSIEAADLAREIARDEAVLKAKRTKLNAIRDLPDFAPTPEIAVAIGDDLHTPLNLLGSPANLNTPIDQIGKVVNSAEAARYWRGRVAELLSAGAAA